MTTSSDATPPADETSGWRGHAQVDDAEAEERESAGRLGGGSRRLLGQLLAPYKRAIWLLVLIVLVENAARLSIPYLVKEGIDTGIPPIRESNDLGPLLEAVDPADLARTLNAVATALHGQGEALGQAISTGRRFTDGLAPAVDSLVADAGLTGAVADSYRRAAGPFLDTLAQVSTTARTITAKQGQLAALLQSSGAFAETLTSFVQEVGPTAVDVVRVSRPVLALLMKYAPELECFVHGVVKAKSRLDGDIKAKMFSMEEGAQLSGRTEIG